MEPYKFYYQHVVRGKRVRTREGLSFIAPVRNFANFDCQPATMRPNDAEKSPLILRAPAGDRSFKTGLVRNTSFPSIYID